MTQYHFEDELDDLLPPLDDMAGPAKRISSARAGAMIQAAQAAVEGTAVHATPVRARSRARVLLVAAALLAFAGVASAGIYTIVAEPAPAPAPQPKRAKAVVVPEPEPEPEFEILPDDPEPEPDPEAEVEAEPEAEPEVEAEVVREKRAPKDLIRMANERRGDKRYREADKLYQQVIRSAPRSAEAYVATVASAQLRLDHLGSPKSALRLYKHAIKAEPTGALAEEARFGIAESYRALGNDAAERAALTRFLERHPGSPLRSRAKARHAALSE